MEDSSEIGECALCRATADISGSHVIPSLVLKKHKREAFQEHPRYTNADGEHNQQSLETVPLLCDVCEQRLNKYGEYDFALRIYQKFVFTPFTDPHSCRLPVQYEDWLRYFSVSLGWRILAYMMRHGDGFIHIRREAKEIRSAFEIWREFLLDERADLAGRFQYMIPLGPLRPKQYRSNDLSFVNQYIQQVCEWGVWTIGTRVFAYAKLPCFLFLGQIQPESRNVFPKYKIESIGSAVLDARFRVAAPQSLKDLMRERAFAAEARAMEPTQSQREKFRGKLNRAKEAGELDTLFESPEFGAARFDWKGSWSET